MEAGFIVLGVLVVVVGVAIGMIIGKSIAERRYTRETQYTQGTLNVDCSDPEFEPGLFLGLAVPVRDIVSRKYVVLDVDVFSHDSRK